MENNIIQLLQKKIVILDGAMGTMIQKHNLKEQDFRGKEFKNIPTALKANNDILSITKPEVIMDIHKQFLDAGANIISTNTFSANKVSQEDYHMQDYVYEMNFQATKIAKKAAEIYTKKTPENPRFVGGSIGPTNKTLSLSPDVNNPGYRTIAFDDLALAYKEQTRGLLKGGADVLLLETFFDTLNAKAALYGINELFVELEKKIPIMLAATITDASGRTLSGQTLEAFFYSVAHAPLLSVGINCALGAAMMSPYIEEMSQKSHFAVHLYPNAGLPNEFGEYDETPESMASILENYAKNGWLNFVGGCCGTTPQHIQAIAKSVEQYPPRTIPKKNKLLCLSGLEALAITPEANFVNIGERTNVAGSKKFARLIKEDKYEQALKVALEQAERGAQIMDVNMDEAMINSKEAMKKFLNLLAAEPNIAKLPIMIDSSEWDVIEAGLKCTQGKSVVNSISLKEGEEAFKKKAQKILQYGAAVIVMAFDEEGQADTYQRKIDICKRAYEILTQQVNFPPEDIIFDPNILTIATGIEEHNNYAIDFINAIKWIKQNLPHAKVSGGISNLSFSFRGNNAIREAIHSVFLYHAINAGMDMGIVNAGMIEIYAQIPKELLERVEDIIFNRQKDATERLLSFAESFKEENKTTIENNIWKEQTIEQRMEYALLNGNVEFLEQDISDALKKYENPLDIIEVCLMNGMDIVGQLFGEGKMFLPQVIKSARVMKQAVAYLEPHIKAYNKNKKTDKKTIKILLATVKGDVHDIGKNIVSVVLECNGFEVIDVGIMAAPEKILDAVEKEKVDIIGLSGLITPSLTEMIRVAKEMEKRNMKIPLLIGGATTSKIHTAVKIAPNYSGAVVHTLDASKSVIVCNKIIHQKERAINVYRDENDKLRKRYLEKSREKRLVTLKEARNNKLKIDWENTNIKQPDFLGEKKITDIKLDQLINYIDWSPFFSAWKLKGKYPDIFKDEKVGKEAKKLFNDASKVLQQIIDNQWAKVCAVIGFFPCNSVDDDIEIYQEDKGTLEKLYFLRQQIQKTSGEPNYCLSDFIAPKSSGKKDYIGAFAVTCGLDWNKIKNTLHVCDDYMKITLQALANRLVEAETELIHERVRKEYWGYVANEQLSNKELTGEKYQGIRPAPGYPSCPDHYEKKTLFRLLNVETHTNIHLTESMMMTPPSSICGWLFAHKEAKYFGVGKIEKDQIKDYARRQGKSEETIKNHLAINI